MSVIYSKLDDILSNLKIKHYNKVSNELIENNYPFFQKYLKNYQVGGYGNKNVKTTKITTKFDKYTFEIHFCDRETMSVVNDNFDDCITIFIENNIANIHTISYDSTCAKEGLEYPGGGSILFKFALQYLKKNKDKLNINKIKIKD
ncbi:hypothetical protein Catovirus_1_141 [Catovirus CTV1]|uniref:Uncharacterized protein n=1 Tax=Catovirus CTV1 TaxID=1977631 RepID=A0A1V0S8Q9_9VIRU|nr:hypothetical protein Catovirus_1_141 [Catovirus CTV1]